MKRLSICLLAATVFTGTAALAQGELSYTSTDIIKYPRTIYAGEVAGVATNSQGHIFVYQRSGNPWIALGGSRIFTHGGDQLLEFDQNGNFVKEIGKGNYAFTVANSVRVDRQNNVWAVDKTAGMVLKFAPDGRLLMLLGRKPESINITIAGGGGRGGAPAAGAGRGAGGGEGGEGGGRGPAAGVAPGGAVAARGAAAPAAPAAGRGGRGGPPGAGANQDVFSGSTDVAWDAAGNIFVADGGGANSRVAKFTPDGVFIKSFGATGNGNDQLAKPNSIAVDAAGNVYVGDKGNNRVQVLSNDLTYVRSITGVGDPTAICISPGATQYLYVSNSNPMDNLDTGGEIYKLQLNGTVVGRFGKAGKAPKEFASVNQIDCRQNNILYTAEAGAWRVQKITLR